MDISITKTNQPKPIPEEIASFGNLFTDHMFVMDWNEEKQWHDARIVPMDKIPFHPASTVLHYGQGIFEGMKAYKDEQGTVRLFRPEENFKRLNRSAERMAMPSLDIDFCLDALSQLVLLEKDWIPSAPNTSLYIRPFMIATDSTIGIHASGNYRFMIILSPSGPYYEAGLDPINILVEKHYVRAVRGGLGEAKTLANYAASLLAGEEAQREGYAQVLWLDGVERKYIEEVGSMNIMFKVDGKVLTPELNGSILPGITRMSILEMLESWGHPVETLRLPLQTIVDAAREDRLEEVFGTGTAAVISPVKHLAYDGETLTASSDYGGNSLSHRLYNELTSIQTGAKEDPFGWVRVLN